MLLEVEVVWEVQQRAQQLPLSVASMHCWQVDGAHLARRGLRGSPRRDLQEKRSRGHEELKDGSEVEKEPVDGLGAPVRLGDQIGRGERWLWLVVGGRWPSLRESGCGHEGLE